tara:strand:- start:1701 stop:2726 length:1026 start_codon:yes stop_codon:yes gene_type:complete
MTNQGGGSKLVSFLIFILIFSSYSGIVSSDTSSIIESNNVEIISPEVVEILPHDSSAFTQGLLIFEGKIYESTGLYGESSIRVVNISTGVVENFFNLSEIYFAEGIALSDNHIIQLTWRENIGFIYNISTLEQIDSFSFDGEGWGLCSTPNGEIWYSDGSYQISKLNPNNLSSVIYSQTVYYNNSPINRLNELECPFDSGLIYANVWLEDRILAINSSSGNVCSEYDFSHIRIQYENNNSKELNGIAYDEESSLFWITGKNWSNYYLVDLDSDSVDCQVMEKSSDCCNNRNYSSLQIILVIIIGIFVMPFSWPIFGMLFYKIFRRQTQHTPPSRSTEDTPE